MEIDSKKLFQKISLEPALTDQIDAMMFRQMGYHVFDDVEIRNKLRLSDDQVRKIQVAVRRHEMARYDNQGEFERARRQIELDDKLVNDSEGDRTRILATIALNKSVRDRALERQLWQDLKELLDEHQEVAFQQLRSPMPNSLKRSIERLRSSNINTEALPIRGSQTIGQTFPDIAPPEDIAFITEYLRSRKAQGKPDLSAKEIAQIHVLREKIADFADPPRHFPLVGLARLHHSHYKGTLTMGDDRTQVVYLDNTHLHPIAETKSDARSELTEPTIKIIATHVNPVASRGGKLLLRYSIMNITEAPVENLEFSISYGDQLEVTAATMDGLHARDDKSRVTWVIKKIGPGQNSVFELQCKTQLDHLQAITATVQRADETIAARKFPPYRIMMSGSDSAAKTE